ncbi:MAG: hypothetical protein HFI37_07235 [Lachnospiraceae bacterium]|nr:hypothetical protein [Lachnospiraceae bacterium]
MIIENSRVGMGSSRTYTSASVQQSQTLTRRADMAAVFDLSEEGKSLMEQMDEIKEEEKNQKEQQKAENLKKSFERMQTRKTNATNQPEVKSEKEMQLEVLRRILESLQSRRGANKAQIKQKMSQFHMEAYQSTSISQGGAALAPVRIGAGTVMKKQTVVSGFFSEHESTEFAATGMVHTADGRDISFGVSFEMSRSFAAKYEFLQEEDYILTDPLVINMDANVTEISDQKFYFDLDSDGKEEEISFVGEGSGFLALDKNHDGKINDGSELFGTKSGDGFKDLAVYDKDGNGWIDEADDIFKDLKVWTKDKDGNDRLLSLKEAGIGAIYLGSAKTQFSLKDGVNNTQAVIQKTGIYLKESGEVGTVQHVDLAL